MKWLLVIGSLSATLVDGSVLVLPKATTTLPRDMYILTAGSVLTAVVFCICHPINKVKRRKKPQSRTMPAMKSGDLIPITISLQPAFHGGPAYAAHKLGYFEELGLNATFRIYPSGAPQVKDASSWDIGIAGGPPQVQGWTESVLKTVGINNDESLTNALVANGRGMAAWSDIVSAGTLGDTKITVSPNSTAEFVVEECLKMHNISFDPIINFVNDSTQKGVAASLSDPDGNDFGSLWAPTLYTLLETLPSSGIICDGTKVGAHVVGGIMVSNEADETNTETAVLGIAAWLKGITYFKDPVYRDQAKVYLNQFYEEQGFPPLTPGALHIEFSRPLYNLDEQLQMMAKNENGVSTLGSWFQDIVIFMYEGGIIPSLLNAENYMEDKYMKWIAANETLAKWTMTLEESNPTSISNARTGEDTSSAFLSVPISHMFVMVCYMLIM